jgi:hypothetical protein
MSQGHLDICIKTVGGAGSPLLFEASKSHIESYHKYVGSPPPPYYKKGRSLQNTRPQMVKFA